MLISIHFILKIGIEVSHENQGPVIIISAFKVYGDFFKVSLPLQEIVKESNQNKGFKFFGKILKVRKNQKFTVLELSKKNLLITKHCYKENDPASGDD